MFANTKKAFGIIGLLSHKCIPQATHACLPCETKIILSTLLCPTFYQSFFCCTTRNYFLSFSRFNVYFFLDDYIRWVFWGHEDVLFVFVVVFFWTFIVSTWGGNCDSKRNAQNNNHCRELASSSCSCSLDWLTHTVMGQHICSWQDKVKFNCCYFHNECISCTSFKKLDDTAISVREVRNWNMNMTFSCEE